MILGEAPFLTAWSKKTFFFRIRPEQSLDFTEKYYVDNSYLWYKLLVTKNSERRDLFAGALELMILHSLRVKPMHGYALVKHIQLVSEDLLHIEEGSLYPALQRLLRAGLLESREGISAKGRPTRIYRLTREGVKHLEHEKSGFETMFAGISRVLAVSKA